MTDRILQDYSEQVQKLLGELQKQEEPLRKAADLVAEACLSGHTAYVFGCTHSALLAEDVFYRAGAPAFWRPLWGPGMSIATTPGFLTSAMEHSEEVGRSIVECSLMEKGDVLAVLSTSGKNGAPVAVADTALKRGVNLILITSSAYRDQKGNHSLYPNLWAFEDKAVVIDNCVPCGDAAITAGGVPMGPVSTIAGSFLMQTLSAMAVEKITQAGVRPPVFLSSNAPGGAEHNRELMKDPALKRAFFLP